MIEMFFGEYPSFSELMNVIENLESEINKSQVVPKVI